MRLFCLLLFSFLLLIFYLGFAHEGEDHSRESKRRPVVSKASPGAKQIKKGIQLKEKAYEIILEVKPSLPISGEEITLTAIIYEKLPRPDPILGTDIPVKGAKISFTVFHKGKETTSGVFEKDADETKYTIHHRFQAGLNEIRFQIKLEEGELLNFNEKLEVLPHLKDKLITFFYWGLGLFFIGGIGVVIARRGEGAIFILSVLFIIGVVVWSAGKFIVIPKIVASQFRVVKEPPTKHDEDKISNTVVVSKEVQRLLDLTVTPAKKQLVTFQIRALGKIIPKPENMHDLYSPVLGKTVSPFKIPSVGEQVKEGQTLAMIEQTLPASEQLQLILQDLEMRAKLLELESNVTQLKNRLSQKEVEFRRAQTLYSIQALAQKDLEVLQLEHKNLKVELTELQKAYDLYTNRGNNKVNIQAARLFPVTSPITGEIVSLDIRQGEQVAPDKKLFQVINLSTIWVDTQIFEKELSKLKPGLKAVFVSEAATGKVFNARLQTIGKIVNPQTRTVQAIFEASNQDGLLRSGMLVNVVIDVASIEALTLPLTAVLKDEEERVVFVHTAQDRFERRAVLIGEREGDLFIIKEGLKEGERVVSQGAHQLQTEWLRQQSSKESSHD